MVRPFSTILGIVLILIGIAGFFVDGNLLWFQVDTIHNIVHLGSGVVALLAASMGSSYARLYLIIFGAVYGLVAIIGVISGSIVGLFEVNTPDNLLHTVIAASSLTMGLSAR